MRESLGADREVLSLGIGEGVADFASKFGDEFASKLGDEFVSEFGAGVASKLGDGVASEFGDVGLGMGVSLSRTGLRVGQV